jgi:hypothetical protein
MCGKRDQTTEEDLRPIIRNKLAILHDVTDRHLHPAIVDHDPERRKRRAKRHHGSRKHVEPRRYALAPKNEDAEKAGFKGEGCECLLREQRSLDRARHVRQHAPVRTELNGHDDARHAQAKATPNILSKN